MTDLTLAGDRTFRLTPSPTALAQGTISLRVVGGGEDGRLCFVPTAPGLTFVLRGRGTAPHILLSSLEATATPLTGLARLRAWVARHLTRQRLSVLDFGTFEITPSGSKTALRPYRKHLRYASRIGTRPDGAWVRHTPELITGWPAEPVPPRPAGAPKIAVALHLYYTDLWPEIATLLGRWTLPFRLFVTLNRDNPALAADIAAAFPGSDIRVVDNRGRDVRPFLVLLEDHAFAPFDLVCKIHGKKSIGNGRIGLFGDMVRRATFLDLMGSDAQVQHVLSLFADDANLGLVGPKRFRSISEGRTMEQRLGKNGAATHALADRLGRHLNPNTFGFFEGTMFWVRTSALEPLKGLQLSNEFAAPEAGLVDGALEHALERLFNHCAEIAGYRVGDATCLKEQSLMRPL